MRHPPASAATGPAPARVYGEEELASWPFERGRGWTEASVEAFREVCLETVRDLSARLEEAHALLEADRHAPAPEPPDPIELARHLAPDQLRLAGHLAIGAALVDAREVAQRIVADARRQAAAEVTGAISALEAAMDELRTAGADNHLASSLRLRLGRAIEHLRRSSR